MRLRPDHNARPLDFKKTSRYQKLEGRRQWKPKATSKAQINIQMFRRRNFRNLQLQSISQLVVGALHLVQRLTLVRSEFQMLNRCWMKQDHQLQTAIWMSYQTEPWIFLQIVEAIDRKDFKFQIQSICRGNWTS